MSRTIKYQDLDKSKTVTGLQQNDFLQTQHSKSNAKERENGNDMISLDPGHPARCPVIQEK